MNADHSSNDALLIQNLMEWSRQSLGILLKDSSITVISVSTPYGMVYNVLSGEPTIDDVCVLCILESTDSLHYLVFGENRGYKGGVPFIYPREWITEVIYASVQK